MGEWPTKIIGGEVATAMGTQAYEENSTYWSASIKLTAQPAVKVLQLAFDTIKEFRYQESPALSTTQEKLNSVRPKTPKPFEKHMDFRLYSRFLHLLSLKAVTLFMNANIGDVKTAQVTTIYRCRPYLK